MHTARHLAGRVESGDGLVIGTHAGAVGVDQEATHAWDECAAHGVRIAG